MAIEMAVLICRSIIISLGKMSDVNHNTKLSLVEVSLSLCQGSYGSYPVGCSTIRLLVETFLHCYYYGTMVDLVGLL